MKTALLSKENVCRI